VTGGTQSRSLHFTSLILKENPLWRLAWGVDANYRHHRCTMDEPDGRSGCRRPPSGTPPEPPISDWQLFALQTSAVLRKNATLQVRT
jgi:hypothetical protein